MWFAQGVPPGCDFKLISAVDGQGRSFRSSASSGLDSDYIFGLDLPPKAQTVDLTFAVTPRVSVEFLAKPSRMTVKEIEKLRKELGYQ